MKPSIVKSTSTPSAEPRTGVVRKVSMPVSSAAPPALSVVPQSSNSQSSISPSASPPAVPRPSGMRRTASGWRCLEQRPQKRRLLRRPASVSIAQISMQGERLRESGPADWLPEATDFVQRAALLVAQGLGFERCRSVSLQGTASVLSVADAGPTTIVGITGPSQQLSGLLRKRGLK